MHSRRLPRSERRPGSHDSNFDQWHLTKKLHALLNTNSKRRRQLRLGSEPCSDERAWEAESTRVPTAIKLRYRIVLEARTSRGGSYTASRSMFSSAETLHLCLVKRLQAAVPRRSRMQQQCLRTRNRSGGSAVLILQQRRWANHVQKPSLPSFCGHPRRYRTT